MKLMGLFYKLMMVRRIFILVSIVGGSIIKYGAATVTSFTVPSFSLPTVDISPAVTFLSGVWAHMSMLSLNDLLLLSAKGSFVLSGLLLAIAVINRIRFHKGSIINSNKG